MPCSRCKGQSTMALTIRWRASRQVSGTEKSKPPRSTVWVLHVERGMSPKLLCLDCTSVLATRNSEFGVQECQTKHGTIGSRKNEFAESSRGCPIPGNRVSISAFANRAGNIPAVVCERGRRSRHPQILSRLRSKAQSSAFSSRETTKPGGEARREKFW